MASASSSFLSSLASKLYIAHPQPSLAPNGQPFTQLYQHLPLLQPLYTNWEKSFQATPYTAFALNTWPTLPLTLIALYGAMLVVVPRLMKDRKALDLKKPLALWNLALSLFSFCGMMRTVPHLLHNIATMSFRDTICTDPTTAYGEGACGLWVMLFIFSKVPELVDTAFIVFRKSKLIFLHWYHHITVLLFCWHSYAYSSSTGLYFVAMNYSVHAIMYGYYFLMAIKAWPKWIPASIITVAQISQMIVGTTICVMSYLYLKDDQPCAVQPVNVLAGGLMYGSYLYLFSEFFVKRFILSKGKASKAKSL